MLYHYFRWIDKETRAYNLDKLQKVVTKFLYIFANLLPTKDKPFWANNKTLCQISQVICVSNKKKSYTFQINCWMSRKRMPGFMLWDLAESSMYRGQTTLSKTLMSRTDNLSKLYVKKSTRIMEKNSWIGRKGFTNRTIRFR